jgi:hypothetical protein
MELKRRAFFKDFGSKTVGLAAGAAAPALVQLNSLGDEFRTLSQQLNSKLARASAEVKEQVQSIHNRLDGAALKLSYQQLQLYFIFLLLIISFAIDAGMTTVWMLG